MEYTKFNNKIQERKVIKGFYRLSDGASAEEIVNETEAGLQMEKDQKYVNNITYKDGLTPEDIATWIAGGRQNAGGSAAPKAAAKKPSFGKKRFAGKK